MIADILDSLNGAEKAEPHLVAVFSTPRQESIVESSPVSDTVPSQIETQQRNDGNINSGGIDRDLPGRFSNTPFILDQRSFVLEMDAFNFARFKV